MQLLLRGGRGGGSNSTVAAASLVVEAADWWKRDKSRLSAGKTVAMGQMTDCVLSLSICMVVVAGWTPDCALQSLCCDHLFS